MCFMPFKDLINMTQCTIKYEIVPFHFTPRNDGAQSHTRGLIKVAFLHINLDSWMFLGVAAVFWLISALIWPLVNVSLLWYWTLPLVSVCCVSSSASPHHFRSWSAATASLPVRYPAQPDASGEHWVVFLFCFLCPNIIIRLVIIHH